MTVDPDNTSIVFGGRGGAAQRFLADVAQRGDDDSRAWINLLIASLAMVATLPGRSQGLGLITEPLLRDLQISADQYGWMNLWATLLGSAFCLGCGPLIDRFGSRIVLTIVMALLGATVVAMSRVQSSAALLMMLTLTRGLGQSALSVVSITIVGKSFLRRLPTAMGVYSFLIGIGFVGAFPGVGAAVMQVGWRQVWREMGWILLVGLAPLAWLTVRQMRFLSQEDDTRNVGGGQLPESARLAPGVAHEGLSLSQALATPAFWAFALAAAMFGLVSSGLMLFNEAVLRERGVDGQGVLVVLGVITFAAMIANVVGGWLAQRWPIGRLMGAAMFLLAAALFALPLARGRIIMMIYAIAMGIAAGIVTVVFFVCWAAVFGRRHLGAIQGAAQLLTVLASATGPLLLALSVKSFHSSTPLLFAMAPVTAILGLACVLTPLPTKAAEPGLITTEARRHGGAL